MPYMPTVLLIQSRYNTEKRLVEYLKKKRITLCSASTSEEVIECLRTKQVDVILIDSPAAKADVVGMDMLYTLQDNLEWESIPVIILSDDDNPEKEKWAFKSGARDFVLKPLRLDAFYTRLNAILRQGRVLRAARNSSTDAHPLLQSDFVGLFRVSMIDGKLLAHNEKWLEMIGAHTQGLGDLQLADYCVHPEEYEQLIESLRYRGEIRDCIIEMNSASSQKLWLSLSAKLHPEQQYFEGVATNVTAAMEAKWYLGEKEKEYRTAFNQAGIGIGHINVQGQWVQVNGKLCSILGYVENELLLLMMQDLVHPSGWDEYQEGLRRLLDGSLTIYSAEKRLATKSGALVWVNLTVSLAHNGDKNSQYFIVVVEDIRERRRVETLLEQTVEGVSVEEGESFFTLLVSHLSTALNVDYAFVGEYVASEGILEVKAMYPEGKLPSGHLISSGYSPSDEVITCGIAWYGRGVRELFPHDYSLRELEVDGYMGIAFYDANENPLGLIAIMSKQPIHDASQKAALLKIFAVRAANEVQRRLAEKELRKSEANLKALFENALQAFLLIDSEMDIRALNKSARVIVQRLWHETITEGDNLDIFIGAENLRSFRKHLAFAFRGRTIDLEWNVPAADGTDYWFEFNFAPVFVDGVVTCVCLSMLDITFRRKAVEQLARSEDRFRTLIEKSTDIITILDVQGVILYESPSIENILGYKQQELLGSLIFELIHPDDSDGVRDAFTSLTAKPGRVATTIFRFRGCTGAWHYLEATGTNLLHNPNIGGVVVNSRDITERFIAQNEREKLLLQLESKNTELKETITALQETQAQLVQSERASAVGNLVAGVMHEINNPNATIYAAIQDALQASDDIRSYFLSLLGKEDQESKEARNLLSMVSDVEQTLKIAVDGVERIKTIVSTLRSFTKHQEAQQQTGDVAVQLESTLTLFHYQYKHVETQCFFPDGDALLITGNLGEINQVLLNLLVNAAQAEATEITIVARRDGDDHVVITIADNGKGMDEETKLKIFEPFFTTGGARNIGLGLNISLKIIEKHDAQLLVESEPSKGTVFTLMFPVVQTDNELTATVKL